MPGTTAAGAMDAMALVTGCLLSPCVWLQVRENDTHNTDDVKRWNSDFCFTAQSKEDLSNVSCDMTLMEPKSTTSTVDTETRMAPFNYSTEQVLDGFSTVNGTHRPSEAINKRTGRRFSMERNMCQT